MQHSIQLLLNYWEIRTNRMTEVLESLMAKGANSVVSFVPWQAFESDISHSLLRFLQASSELGMEVCLIPTPELGVHYRYSGLPKDLVAQQDLRAKHSGGDFIPVHLAPNSFALPSLHSEDFKKRYQAFLTKLNVFIADLHRQSPRTLRNVSIGMTGSFWKYYRNPRDESYQTFGSSCGDRSKAAAIEYRKNLDRTFSRDEFCDPDMTAGNRFKARNFDEVNRRWFFQECEDMFRVRSSYFLKKNLEDHLEFINLDLFCPDADPGNLYSSFLQNISGKTADFFRIGRMIEEYSSRWQFGNGSVCSPYVHLSSVGGFPSLSDSEKQYLILKSVLTLSPRGGGILIDAFEWFELSSSFRNRLETMTRAVFEGKLRSNNSVAYYSSHLWSGGGRIWEKAREALGNRTFIASSVDLIEESGAQVVVFDPHLLLTESKVEKALRWVEEGKIVVLPKSPTYTRSGRARLNDWLRSYAQNPIRVTLGVPYQVNSFKDGKLVFFEIPDVKSEELDHAWKQFIESVVSLANASALCQAGDGRLKLIELESKNRVGSKKALFVMNGTGKKVNANIMFRKPVVIGDLSAVLTSSEETARASEAEPGSRFELEVPPCGIIPLSVREVPSESEASDRIKAEVAKALSRLGASESQDVIGE